MGTGWRRAFCNTVPRERRDSGCGGTTASAPATPRLAASNPPTPRLRCKTFCQRSNRNAENDLEVSTPKLECKTATTTPKSRRGSNPSSPRSPFSILKNTLRLSRNNCGVCMQSVKTGQGTAIYTAECSHAFHFPCIASHVRKQGSLLCPVCNSTWKDVPLLAGHTNNKQNHSKQEEKIVRIDSSNKRTPVSSPKLTKQCELKSYSDDEPLVTPKAGAKFVPILEDNEEEEEVEEFRGFFVNPISSSDDAFNRDSRSVEVSLSPDAAVISQGREYDTCAVVLKVKAPPPPLVRDVSSRRAPIDLVTVLDISGSMTGAKLEMLKRAMRLVISSLGSGDRLSIVAFAAAPKRLLPMRRMTPQGQRAARRIIDRLTCSHSGSSMAEALRQATRVLEERRERNPVASIILLSDGHDDTAAAASNHHHRRGSSQPSSTRFAHVEIPVHSPREPSEDAFSKCVGGLLSVVVQDLRIQLGLAPGSDPAEITAVYTCNNNNERPLSLGSGSIRLGNLYAEEEKELLVEIRVPASRFGSHHVFSVKCSYKDPATEEVVCGGEQVLLVPRPQTVRSGSARIERLRNCFICSRAVAESRRLIERGELSSAMQLLSSARALLIQARSESGGNYIRCLEAEMSEVQWRRQLLQRRRTEGTEVGLFLDENWEPLTPTSAWRAADKLAKAAQMKKSFTIVSSDLHGFDNARF